MDRSENVAVVNRPAAYAELLVDSTDRYDNGYPTVTGITTSSDWTTRLQQIVLNGYFTRLGVTQIQFHWNLPTIITGYNDQLVVQVTAGAGVGVGAVTIPQGYYTPTALATALQGLLNAQPTVGAATWTVTFSNLTGGFILSVAGAGSLFNIFNNPNLRGKRFLETAGLQYFTSPPAAVFNGNTPTMLPTRFVDICSSTLTKFQRVKDTTTLKNPTISNIIARIYPVAPNTRININGATALTDTNSPGSYPFTICIDYNNPKWIKWEPQEALSNFDLQLRDQNGNLLPFDTTNFSYGCEYQLTIVASES